MMGWVKCCDRLPEKNQMVLIHTNWEGKNSIGLDYVDYGSDGNVWACTSQECITHWMPLPNPPSGSQEKASYLCLGADGLFCYVSNGNMPPNEAEWKPNPPEE